jgi:hypothetical protein
VTARHHAHAGPEPYRRHLAAADAAAPGDRIVRYDAETHLEAALAALAAPAGLFGTETVHVTNAQLLPVKDLPRLLEEHPGTVVLEADTIPVKTERAIAATTTVVKHPSSGTAAQQGIVRIAATLGTSIDMAIAAHLLAATGGDPGHVVSVLEACASAGIDPITRGHVTYLAVPGPENGTPWALLDALGSRTSPGLSELMATVEPIGALAFLSKRWITAVLVAEGLDADAAGGLLGAITPAALRDSGSLARRTNADSRAAVLSALADADGKAKSGRGAEGLTQACAAIAQALRGSSQS